MNGIVPFKGGQLQAAGVPKFWFGLARMRSSPPKSFSRQRSTEGPPILHPHARGDNEFTQLKIGQTDGSPPRAWGQRVRRYIYMSALRFTPTRVGTTCPCTLRPAVVTIHPHARGDNIITALCSRPYRGSPPRAWGQLVMLNHTATACRFTPTRVGTTSARSCRPTSSRFTPTRVGTTQSCSYNPYIVTVHPHARGDNSIVFLQSVHCNGSPPRAWGQLHELGHEVSRRRFTPTRVGTTSLHCRRISWRTVHPHARGDNSTGSSPSVPAPGSPPRAWGQRIEGRPGIAAARFTPTRVGTTNQAVRPMRHAAVHPHARGDNSFTLTMPARFCGSPPRAWGQPQAQRLVVLELRFTPTRVGTTAESSSQRTQSPVHPHARGDNAMSRAPQRKIHGSPPRAWGQRNHGGGYWSLLRFTPTRVGTTRVACPPHPPFPVHPHARGDNANIPGPGPDNHGSPPRAWGQPR